ncbi:four helix bundle protein [Ferruginibacter paludis]|uniref:four helix bundle protein n=1 Tax=Ferruginibacter paludis TaxID=1310417 RepID=UPI0025B2C467|nr:four helix bundle protein [Ferruginibacter paludis]MDN3657560.1 four helix bundle protein [Ferruginibacter paludis]
MKNDNLILDKSFQFSLRIVKLFVHLKETKVERDLCLQLLRSGTSVGPNVEESVGGSSIKDFAHKLEIAYREARETRYWLRLMKESELQESKLAESFISDCEEIIKILTAILNSTKYKQMPEG